MSKSNWGGLWMCAHMYNVICGVCVCVCMGVWCMCVCMGVWMCECGCVYGCVVCECGCVYGCVVCECDSNCQ